ncbi:hypothetical protein ID866_9987 [Astraeus odoratus]|nr:hypothetical protein ID866_9987 [Astraeus odoratus]
MVRPLHGGSAIVYQGTLGPQGQRVVVKSLRLSPSSDSAAIDHIIRNVQLWSKLRHTNVVRVFGLVTKFDFAVSIILDYIPKGNAFDYVQNRHIDPRPILLDVARGLHYLHTYDPDPIFHGDLRARNVLISADGRGLLSDYGLSSLIDTSFSMTAAAPIHPTVRWMAPEQIHDFGKVTIQGDVWAFGMTALELFTRRPPYDDARDTRGVIHRILKGPPNRPSDESTRSRMTDPWWEMCSLCWEPESVRPPVADIVKKITSVVRIL